MIKQNKRAFTLAELLVVVIIIAILGTIAFISLQKYSKTARDARRLSDTQNIRKSLELFGINTGKYPVPDNAVEVSYSGELLWRQGTLGDNVFRNLSKNLSKIPLDPLFNIEYVYSILNNKTEYEIMTIYEQKLSSNKIKILTETYAGNNYNIKVEGTYNKLYVMTPSFLFPTPSIIGSVSGSLDMLDNDIMDSIVFSGENNIPNLYIPTISTVTGTLDLNLVVGISVNKNSLSEDKILAVETLQQAFLGTFLENYELYKLVITRQTATEKLELANWIFGGDFTGDLIVDLSCIIDGNIVQNGDSIDLYSEDYIDELETYDCQSIYQERSCENTVLDGENIYKFSSCTKGIADDCSPQSYTYNTHTYNLPTIKHGETLEDLEIEYLISQSVNENNGKYLYKLVNSLSCNDGTFINFNENENVILFMCDDGYVVDGNDCLFAGEVDISGTDTLVCPGCAE